MNMDTKVNVNFNAIVTEKGNGFVKAATVAIDRKGNTYETEHLIQLGSKVKLSKGDYIHCEGHLDTNENGVNLIEPVKLEVLAETPEDLKMNAWIVGEASSNFIEPKAIDDIASDKKPFGVATVKLANRFQRGIVFNNLIPIFRKNLKAGAVVRLAGRIQYRSYMDKDENERVNAEIICDNSHTEILKMSRRKNPFAFSEATEVSETPKKLVVSEHAV